MKGERHLFIFDRRVDQPIRDYMGVMSADKIAKLILEDKPEKATIVDMIDSRTPPAYSLMQKNLLYPIAEFREDESEDAIWESEPPKFAFINEPALSEEQHAFISTINIIMKSLFTAEWIYRKYLNEDWEVCF